MKLVNTAEQLKKSPIRSDGVMGKLIEEFDWSKTPIGPSHQWSESLKNLVNTMLLNRFPMLLWWGEHYVQIYNDAYIPVLGLKHPSPGLGRPGYECWDEIWSVIGPLVDKPFNGGPATWMDDILLMVNRNNFVEETHFTIAYSPVPDPSVTSGLGGVLATVNEITGEVISRRQMETLRKLGKEISALSSLSEVYSKAANVLAENKHDIPFAFIHKLDSKFKAHLVSASGIPVDHSELLTEIDLTPTQKWIDFTNAAKEGKLVLGEQEIIASNAPTGIWNSAPTQYAYLPITEAKRGAPIAIVTLALNPHRKFDDSYSNFVQLIGDQISAGVTNVIAYEKEKQRAEELAELHKAKTIFFSNVSHEFRTPLTLMLGPLDDLLTQKQDKIIVEREAISLIQRNSLRLQKLVNTLLDFSRIEAGRMQMTFKQTDIAKLTCDLASNFTPITEKAGIKLILDCPKTTGDVYLDEEMWEKIVLNLLSNAFKFTFTGSITVRLKSLLNAVELTISDTGIGISEEDQKLIFERFHRVTQARSRSFEGSGIGLSLVHELVKLHGGTIVVESKPELGTSFTVTIPKGTAHLPQDQINKDSTEHTATSVKANAFLEEALRWFPDEIKLHTKQSATSKNSNTSVKPSIILADDNSDMRDYIRNILGEYCHVHTVANGKEAIELAKEIKPDLILSDIMMPEVDGFRLLELVRQDTGLKTTPFILLSARAGEEAKVEGLQAGADDYLTKPFTRNELIARVNSNIHLSSVRRELEQAIRKSEARLRALVIATSDVIYRMSADWKVMRQLDGRDFLQDTGEPLAEWQPRYIHPKDRARVSQMIKEAIENKSVFQLEHQVIRADGTLGWTFSRAVPILSNDGEIIEWFGAASDITDRKRYQAELEHKHEELEHRVDERTKELHQANSALTASNSDLQQFAHVASHDLKEPVRKIKTFTYRLMDDENITKSEQSNSYLEKILTSAQRMSTMIEGVLAYSSLNGAYVEFEQVDLNIILEDIKTDLELIIKEKQARIEYSKLPTIFGGNLLLYQLFYNLISNSLKFSHPDRAPFIQLSWQLDKSNLKAKYVFKIEDNGIGFEQQFSELIFDTFSRLNAKDQFDGTGLGLSLCRKIVERHNGSIRAEGIQGKGSIFTIELPIAKS